MKVSDQLRNSRWYFIILSFVLFTVIVLLIVNDKTIGHIPADSYHPFLLNVFFINLTFIGDGIFAVCLSALFLFYYRQKEKGLAFFYSFLITGIIVQLLKNLINATGPKLFFEAGGYLHLVEGENLTGISGFISGHTALAFAIATVMVLLMKDKKWQLPVLVVEILVGYSRIYLARHYLQDVIFGVIIGTGSGILSYYIVCNRKLIRRSINKLHQLNNTDSSSPASAIQPV